MREQRLVFDEVAGLCARRRPTYPSALIDAVVERSGLAPVARLHHGIRAAIRARGNRLEIPYEAKLLLAERAD